MCPVVALIIPVTLALEHSSVPSALTLKLLPTVIIPALDKVTLPAFKLPPSKRHPPI